MCLALLSASSAASLANGLTLAWATPIFKQQLIPASSPMLGLVANAITREWEQFINRSEARPVGQSKNDAFFEWQRRGFEAGGQHFLATLTGAAGEAMREWHAAWQQAIAQHVASAAGVEAARAVSARQLALYAWAGVLTPCSDHGLHFHEDAIVSGTLYLSVPSGSGGAFIADDPRGPRPARSTTSCATGRSRAS